MCTRHCLIPLITRETRHIFKKLLASHRLQRLLEKLLASHRLLSLLKVGGTACYLRVGNGCRCP